MKFQGIPLVYFLLFSFSPAVLVSAQNPPEPETYPVRIILEPRKDARFYQIEWLEENEISGEEEAPKGTSLKEKVTRTEIRRDLPTRYRYFRLRSAYRDGLYGPWGEVVEIQRPSQQTHNQPSGKPGVPGSNAGEPGAQASANNQSPEGKQSPGKNTTAKKRPAKHGAGAKPIEPQDVFAQVIDREGKEKWVLRGNTLPADHLDSNTPLWYEVECLTEKDAPENTNGRQRYEGPMPFVRAGQYRLRLFNSEDATATAMQTWTFWVYTDVPRTYVKFYAPFLHGRGGFIVGARTKISLVPQFSGAAIDQVEYRIYADGEQPGSWKKYEDEIEVASFANGKFGYYNFEFRSTNVAGTMEPPQSRRMLIDAKGPVIEERKAEDGSVGFNFTDENFPIVVRVYQNGKLVQDMYFKQWRSHELFKAPADAGYEIRAIDLLGNETKITK